MNLDEFKNQSRTVKAPQPGKAGPGPTGQTVNQFIEQLKAQDEMEARQLKKARPLWLLAAGVFSLVYLALVCFPPLGLRPARLWLSGVLAAVYLLNALLLARKLRLLRQNDYTESVRLFLQKAERQLQFMRPQDWWLTGVGLVILGVVGCLYVLDILIPRYLDVDRRTAVIVFYIIGYAVVCGAGFFFTYRNWNISKAPLLRNIRRLKSEMTADGMGSSKDDHPKRR